MDENSLSMSIWMKYPRKIKSQKGYASWMMGGRLIRSLGTFKLEVMWFFSCVD
jgi:hypothetical protein